MIPIVTPEEMGAIDAAAPEPVEELIGRAGAATARAALRLLGGAYGRRVVVVAGKGNNGNDGRDAAERLRRRGVRVQVIPATEAPDVLPPADLVIDAAYGTGFRGEYRAPLPTPPIGAGFGTRGSAAGPYGAGTHGSGGTASGAVARPPVLAVDIPSGVNGLTGEVSGAPVRADATVTFAALKPGLLLPPGAGLTGTVEVADIGLDVSRTRAGLVEQADVAGWIPERSPWAHKWDAAVLVVAGSPGMTGAAVLACASAARSGAGMVRYLVPGLAAGAEPRMPVEAVGVDGSGAGSRHLGMDRSAGDSGAGRGHTDRVGFTGDPGAGEPAEAERRAVAGGESRASGEVGDTAGRRPPVDGLRLGGQQGQSGTQGGWVEVVAADLAAGRLHALVIGPGMGLGADVLAGVPALTTGPAKDIPVVVDGDGLSAVAEAGPEILRGRSVPAVLTPHDGEAARLTGAAVPSDRCAAARDLAARSGSVVLLKGPATVVAHPGGQVRTITTGDERLATAGSGDVLSGLIGALLARGAPPFDAAAAGAWLHGSAASHTPGVGMVAGDIVTALPATFSDLR